MLEPVSPELVLVDPELAARVRASPIEDAPPYALHATRVLTGAAELTPRQPVTANGAARTDTRPGHSRAFKRLGGSLLGIGLMLSGFAVAYGVSGNDSEQSAVAPAEVGTTVPAAVGGSRRASARTVDRQRHASVARTTARTRPTAKPRRRRSAAAQRRRSAGSGRQQELRQCAKRAPLSNGNSLA